MTQTRTNAFQNFTLILCTTIKDYEDWALHHTVTLMRKKTVRSKTIDYENCMELKMTIKTAWSK